MTEQVSITNDYQDEDHDEAMSKDERKVIILLVDDQVFNLILLENLIGTIFPNAVFETALNGKLALEKV